MVLTTLIKYVIFCTGGDDMSRFSGKCDFYDHIEINGIEKVLASNIYIGENIIPLKINSEKDCIPYYAHIVYLSTPTTARLTTRSWIDEEEDKVLTRKIERVKKYYRKCKRNKVPFNKEEALHLITSFLSKYDYEEEIVNRVIEYGEKATINNIHTYMHEHYRKELFYEMINNGYSPPQSYYWLWHVINPDHLTELINSKED